MRGRRLHRVCGPPLALARAPSEHPLVKIDFGTLMYWCTSALPARTILRYSAFRVQDDSGAKNR